MESKAISRLAAAVCAAGFAVSAAASTIAVDKAARAVSFDAVATGCGQDATVEFFLAGPGSDHDYETMFLLVDSVAELAAAFDEAGIPRGRPVSYRDCRFWPVGEKVVFEPDLWDFIAETRGEAKAPVVFTGGSRSSDGAPHAATNMPLAVFALYDCGQSLMQFDDSLAQGATYGRFRPALDLPRGERRRFTVRWDGKTGTEHVDLALKPGGIRDAIAALRERSAARELDVTVSFAPEMTVGEAAAAAAALQMLDSPRVKFNGFAQGQFFYSAFRPLEKWRDRTERLTQPYEIRLASGLPPRLTVVEEDWTTNTQSPDPLLVVHENVAFADIGAKWPLADTCLVFAPRDTPVSEVFALRKLLPPEVSNWYVYADGAPATAN